MGSEQLAGVMDIIKTNAAKKKGIKLDKKKWRKIKKHRDNESETNCLAFFI